MSGSVIQTEFENFMTSFAKNVKLTDAQQFQFLQAFYAGFGACFGTMINIVDALGHDEDSAAERLERIKLELDTFSEFNREIAKEMGVKSERIHITSGMDEVPKDKAH